MPFLLYTCDPAHAVGSVDGRLTITEFRESHLCPECYAEFSGEVDLGDHLTTEHPILQPHLLVGGTRVPANWVIRQPLDTSAFQIMNATEVELGIDGGPLRSTSAETFQKVLARTPDGILELLLRARGTSRRYEIRILIPDEEELRLVEGEFTAHLARNDVTVSDVRRFDEALSVGAGAREYASALADYVYGVLAKEGAGQTTLPFAGFPEKLKRSLAIVRGFERPLAAALASCIRFNLNDFRSAWKPCGVQMLDRAFWVFRQRALLRTFDSAPPSPRQTGLEVPLCPVDTVTQTILDVVYTPTPVSALREMASRHDLSDEDRVKACVLLADEVAGLKPEDAAACRAALTFDPIFAKWADRALRGVS